MHYCIGTVTECEEHDTCGVVAVADASPVVPNAGSLQPNETVIFCHSGTGASQAIHYASTSLEADPVNSWKTLDAYTDPTDLTNTCNCAQAFASPGLMDEKVLNARGCATIPYPKIQMLNSDMVQSFPISGTGGIKNLIGTGRSVIANLGHGEIDEFCGPAAVNPIGVSSNGKLNSNERSKNTHLTFPQVALTGTNNQQGFGCVKNTVGNIPNFLGVPQQQTVQSTLLPVDPNKGTISLWATVNAFMTHGISDTCINGVSTYNNPLDGATNPYTFAPQLPVTTYDKYSGTVAAPIVAPRFVGQNILNGLDAAASCTPATPPNGEGRDNFYREFEVAWVKMTTVGFYYRHTFTDVQRVMNGVKSLVTVEMDSLFIGKWKLGKLYDIVLKNPRQRSADIASGTRTSNDSPALLLPDSISWNTVTGEMIAGPLYGSSTCYWKEVNC